MRIGGVWGQERVVGIGSKREKEELKAGLNWGDEEKRI